jgi:glycosyltransferase involved in cell wall biosynthesis
MPPITAILHTCNDEVRLGRALESLRPCDEIVIVDHGSSDGTLRVAREFAAIIRSPGPDTSPLSLVASIRYDWALFLLPSEALTEDLEASLYEWKLHDPNEVKKIPACSTTVREETSHGWTQGRPCTRLIPKGWNRWDGNLPGEDRNSMILLGDLLRFRVP